LSTLRCFRAACAAVTPSQLLLLLLLLLLLINDAPQLARCTLHPPPRLLRAD
jgi:hypothetical protein